MLSRLLASDFQPDDKDHFENKRFETSGVLMNDVFVDLLRMFQKDLHMRLLRSANGPRGMKSVVDAFEDYIRPDMITKQMQYCLSTGNWAARKVCFAPLAPLTHASRPHYVEQVFRKP